VKHWLGDIRIYPDPDDAFIREPAVADFRAGHLRLHTDYIHSIFGDTKAERRAEAELLDEVYAAVQDAAVSGLAAFGGIRLRPMACLPCPGRTWRPRRWPVSSSRQRSRIEPLSPAGSTAPGSCAQKSGHAPYWCPFSSSTPQLCPDSPSGTGNI